MESLSDSLPGRVEQMIQAYRGCELRPETGTRAAVEELVARNEALEEIVRQLASELERVAARCDRMMSRLEDPRL